MYFKVIENRSSRAIMTNVFVAFVSLFVNGLGVYLTIHASIGAGPWDVLSIGVSKSLGILYGNASVAISFTILVIDILMKEPIGLAMFIDALTVGKAVDFFNYINVVPVPKTLPGAIVMMIIGLFIMGYTQFFYMRAGLGCGPRDTLLVGTTRLLKKIPIGAVSIATLALSTFVGYLLGGPVGIGTIVCAFATGPIMQFTFRTVNFNPTTVKHQRLRESFRIISGKSSS